MNLKEMQKFYVNVVNFIKILRKIAYTCYKGSI